MASPKRFTASHLRRSKWPDLLGLFIPNYRRRWLLLRIRYIAWRFHSKVQVDIAKEVRVGKRVNIEVRSWTKTRLSVGQGTTIGDDVRFRLRGGSIDIGEDVDIRPMCVLNVGNGQITIDGTNILGWGTVLHCADSIHLARFVYIAEYTTIVDSTHFHSSPDTWSHRNLRTAPIDIGVDTWICPKATITSGVTIGDHTIVASNSVVVKDVPAGVLVSGVPAKIIRELDLPWKARDGSQAELA